MRRGIGRISDETLPARSASDGTNRPVAGAPGWRELLNTESDMSASEIYSPGLEGVIAGETAVSTVADGLSYRGYPVTELAEKTTFDEVAYLLLHGDLPTAAQLDDFRKRVAAARHIPGPLRDLLRALPRGTPPMDALRSAVSVLAHFDP